MAGTRHQNRGEAAGRTQVGRLVTGDQIMWGGRIVRVTESRGLTTGLWYLVNDLGEEMTTSPKAPVLRVASAQAVVAA